ncbi:glycosyltransferase family protein [Oscillospiraceae bacterium 38-13]
MRFAAMIQARCGSSRLPGKILMDLEGKTILQRVIERLQRCKYIDETVVVTSVGKENLPVLRLCADLGIRVFAGAEEDVLDRFYQMAKLIKPEYIIRVTADCPCYDYKLLECAIESLKPEMDYLWDEGETLPDGLDLEIVKFSALKRSWEEARLTSEREHVTQYIRKNPEIFRIQNFPCPVKGISHLRWTLDEPEDYALIEAIYGYFLSKGNEYFLMEDVLRYLAENPEISRINSKYTRNEGLEKSLQEDKIADLL